MFGVEMGGDLGRLISKGISFEGIFKFCVDSAEWISYLLKLTIFWIYLFNSLWGNISSPSLSSVVYSMSAFKTSQLVLQEEKYLDSSPDHSRPPAWMLMSLSHSTDPVSSQAPKISLLPHVPIPLYSALTGFGATASNTVNTYPHIEITANINSGRTSAFVNINTQTDFGLTTNVSTVSFNIIAVGSGFQG